jgi:hypothetical protein
MIKANRPENRTNSKEKRTNAKEEENKSGPYFMGGGVRSIAPNFSKVALGPTKASSLCPVGSQPLAGLGLLSHKA